RRGSREARGVAGRGASHAPLRRRRAHVGGGRDDGRRPALRLRVRLGHWRLLASLLAGARASGGRARPELVALLRWIPLVVFDGSGWAASMDARPTPFPGASTITVGRKAYLDAFTAVYAEPLSNRVVIRTAPAIAGPWSDPALLFAADKPDGDAYDIATHAEY